MLVRRVQCCVYNAKFRPDLTLFILNIQACAYHFITHFPKNRYMSQKAIAYSASPSKMIMNGHVAQSLQKTDLVTSRGDLNNVSAMRATEPPQRDPAFAYRSLAIEAEEDDPDVRRMYRPFLLSDEVQQTDWVSQLELATATKMAYEDLQKTGSRLRVLVLYGSLRKRLLHSLRLFCSTS